MKIPPKLALVTTLKTSENIIKSFVNYHLNIGIDRLYLFFDDPYDPSIDIFLKRPNITVVKCTSAHWKKIGCNENSDIEIRQTLNADLALAWAKLEGIDWITHIDADELIYTEKQSIKSILSTLNKDTSYLWMPTLEAIPSKLETVNPFTEINNFKIPQENNTINLDKLSSTLFYNEYFRGHIGGKSFARTQGKIKSLRIHKPEPVRNNKLIENTIKNSMLLHYDCYDYKSWLEKWRRRYDGSARFTGRDNRNKQFEEFKVVFENNRTDALLALYKKLHLIPQDTIELLKKLGYAKNININARLFDETQ